MHLQTIRLTNFKNYESAELDFSSQINCFLGNNGSGKTNLLDAIYYLSLTKSSTSSQDQQCILHNESLFSIKGEFSKDEKRREVICGLQSGKKKLVKLDQKPYKKASEHVGKFPVVLIAPNDTDVIRGASDLRRKFFDAIIAQVDQHYLQTLIQYNHLIKQRNSLLKRFAETGDTDLELLEPFDQQLLNLGCEIYEKRSGFIEDFKVLVNRHYENLTNAAEEVELNYESHFQSDAEALLKESLQKDIILKRSNIGIHKDEFHFLMNGETIKRFGSQGQQKSYLIALKLAHFDFTQKQTGMKPILLLDDIFDKLDDLRISKLMEMVASDTFGQIFITDARPERTIGLLADDSHEVELFEVVKGQAKPWKHI